MADHDKDYLKTHNAKKHIICNSSFSIYLLYMFEFRINPGIQESRGFCNVKDLNPEAQVIVYSNNLYFSSGVFYPYILWGVDSIHPLFTCVKTIEKYNQGSWFRFDRIWIRIRLAIKKNLIRP